jgi:hypothetical protein
VLIPPIGLHGLRLPTRFPVLDLEPRLRCRELMSVGTDVPASAMKWLKSAESGPFMSSQAVARSTAASSSAKIERVATLNARIGNA